MNKNLIVTLANAEYVNQAKQLFSSVFWNSGWEGDYMLLSHEIPDSELKWFTDKGIYVRKCNSLAQKNTKYYYNPVVLDKFYLFTPEFKKWETVIFLDSDIIVKDSLNELTKVRYFSAVPDIYDKKLNTQFFNSQATYFNGKEYNTDVLAFNSGVFSFKTNLIDENSFQDLLSIFNSNREEFQYLDQAAMNLFFYQKWDALLYVYNAFILCHNFRIPRRVKFVVMHFVNTPEDYPKLWDNNNLYYNEWKQSLDKAELINLSSRVKAEKLSKFRLIYSHLWIKRIVITIKFYKAFGAFKYRIKYFLTWAPEKLIGNIGKVVLKLSPKLHNAIKTKVINKM
jgi:lipopolysaccharide biosynthesis glycosyltransferase